MNDKKRVFLIYPTFPSGLFASISPGLLSLAAHTAHNYSQIPITLWDERLDGEFDPAEVEGALVGISVMTAQVPRAKRIAERAREAGAFGIVFGGIHPTVCPEEFYSDGSVVQGEIEGGSFAQVLADYTHDRPLAKTYFTPVVSLENLPLAPSEFYEYAAKGADELISDARGCVLRCSYCSIHIIAGQKIRHRPVDNVISELKARKLLHGNPDRQISFTNDAFGFMPQDRLLLEKIKQELDGRDFKWLTQIGLRPLQDDSFLELVNTVGHAKLVVGLESPFRDGLSTEKKGILGLEPVHIFEKIRTYSNIRIRLLLMLGFDFEPRDVFEHMLQFIRQLRPDGVYISILTPFPGTQIAERLEAEGRLLHKNWGQYDTRHLVFERRFKQGENRYGTMTPEEFMAGYRWLVQEAQSEIKTWSRFTSEGQVL